MFPEEDRKNGIVLILLISVLFISAGTEASEVALPAKDEEVYAVSENTSYDLKVKLKPKIIESRVYFQGKESVDWQEEIDNWRFGFLSADRGLPPLIIDKENFYPREEDRSGKYFWGENNMKLSVFNPLKVKVATALEFSANSYRQQRTLDVLIDGRVIDKIEVPSERFSCFKVENLSLNPGINEIRFFCPEGTTAVKPEEEQRDKKIRKVSVRFKDNIRFKIKPPIPASRFRIKGQPRYGYEASDIGLDVFVYLDRDSQPFILTRRALEVNLEEYPYLDFIYSPRQPPPSGRLKIFLGVDYSQDNEIDNYLELTGDNLKAVLLLELARGKWKDIDFWPGGFKVRGILLLGLPDREMVIEEPCHFEFRLENFCFYNHTQALCAPLSKVKPADWKVEECIGTTCKSFVDKKGEIVFDTYFDSRQIGTERIKEPEETKIVLKDGSEFTGVVVEETQDAIRLERTEELAGGEVNIKKDAISYSFIPPKKVERRKILEEESLCLKFNNLDLSSPCAILKIVYKLDNPSVQTIEAFLDLDKDGDGVVDRKILAGEREVLRSWRFAGVQGDMDLYEIFLSDKFPANYSTERKNERRFVVYKKEQPLETTWRKWDQGRETVEVGVAPRKVVISVPRGEVPESNYYSVIYYPLPAESPVPGYEEYEADLSWMALVEPESSIKGIAIRLSRKNEVYLDQEKKGWYSFCLRDVGFSRKFAYPVKEEENQFLDSLRRAVVPLIKIDEKSFHLHDFEGWRNLEDLEKGVLWKRIELARGSHKYEVLENDTFDVEWTILAPEDRKQKTEVRSQKTEDRRPAFAEASEGRQTREVGEEPGIVFKKMNPTKYLVKVEGAENPFWLVFSESFHGQWRLYEVGNSDFGFRSSFDEIIAEYPEWKVKEAKHLMKFAPQDIRFLFEKPLEVSHHLVNGYANGWYIEPERSGLGRDFTLVIYFRPQSLFYLGLIISGLTFTGCVSYLVVDKCRRKSTCS